MQARRRVLNVAALLLAVGTPPLIALIVALSAYSGQHVEFREIAALFLPFGALCILFAMCMMVYLWELRINKDLSPDTRKGWAAAIVVFPWSLLAFWWLYVRRAADGQE